MSEFDEVEIDLDDVPESEPVATFYPNVDVWVREWLLPHFKRNPKSFRWDPRWWEYTEVVARLEALWRSWEFLRGEGMTGMSVFFRDYLGPEMREITAPDGPFWRLSDVQDRQLPDTWPVEVPPPGLFLDAHHPAEQ